MEKYTGVRTNKFLLSLLPHDRMFEKSRSDIWFYSQNLLHLILCSGKLEGHSEIWERSRSRYRIASRDTNSRISLLAKRFVNFRRESLLGTQSRPTR